MRRAAGLARRLVACTPRAADTQALCPPAAALDSCSGAACGAAPRAAGPGPAARWNSVRWASEVPARPVFDPVHIQDEAFCRQRQLIPLGHREPILAPDTWIAPNAVCIGDCDLFDKARSSPGSRAHPRCPQKRVA